MFTKEDVEEFILNKQHAWSLSTLRSERYRLLANMDILNEGPGKAYILLVKAGMKGYSIKTLFIRAATLEEYLGITSTYKAYLAKNANIFKRVYKKERLEMTYKEARQRLEKMPTSKLKEAAMVLLGSGMRASEAINYDGSGVVTGKGGKQRAIVVSNDLKKHAIGYFALYRYLRKIGLKPHTMRKLAATELANNGLREADLMEVMGWSSIQTASSYLQPNRTEELKKQVNTILGGK